MGGSLERNQPRWQGLSADEWFHVSGRVPEVLIEPLLAHHAKLMKVVQQARGIAVAEDDKVTTGRGLS